MMRLVGRKLLFILLLIPVLSFVGYQYALLYPQAARIGRNRLDVLPYPEYVMNVFQGDLGSVGRVPLIDILPERVMNSLVLIVLGIAITAIGGVIIGLLSVSRKTRRIAMPGLLLTTAGSSLPGFLLGGVIISMIVYITLYGGSGQRGTFLPMSGFGLDAHLVLPLIVLASRPMLHVSKVTSGLLENELHQDYVRVARSKGFKWSYVYSNHAFRTIIAPILIVLGQSMRLIVAGLLIVEMMFLWPGIGQLFVYGIAANENLQGQWQYYANPYLISALAVIIGVILLTADLITDVSAQIADPRLREEEE